MTSCCPLPALQVVACVWALARLGCAFDPAWVAAVPRALLRRWTQQLRGRDGAQWGELSRKESGMLLWACKHWGLEAEVASLGAQVSAASLKASECSPQEQPPPSLASKEPSSRSSSSSSSSSSKSSGEFGGGGPESSSGVDGSRHGGVSSAAVALLALAHVSCRDEHKGAHSSPQQQQQQQQQLTESKKRRMAAALLKRVGRDARELSAQDLSQVRESSTALAAAMWPRWEP